MDKIEKQNYVWKQKNTESFKTRMSALRLKDS
jgi:hypothetical protein